MIQYFFLLLFNILSACNAGQDTGSSVLNAVHGNITLGNIRLPKWKIPIIIGGDPVDITAVPYIVSLQDATDEGSHICGGSIIRPNVILTAAHCVKDMTADDLQIRAGSSLNYTGGVVVKVSRVVVHPDYITYTKGYDVALLWLAERLEYGSYIQEIEMAASGAELADGVQAIVSGWGFVSESGPYPHDSLRAVYVPIVGSAACNESYHGDITDTMICAGLTEGGRDACQYDSGGPLVASDNLYGIVSWAVGCARRNKPGVYASVAALRRWIDATLLYHAAGNAVIKNIAKISPQ